MKSTLRRRRLEVVESAATLRKACARRRQSLRSNNTLNQASIRFYVIQRQWVGIFTYSSTIQAGMGTVAVMMVPWPGRLSSSSVPPR